MVALENLPLEVRDHVSGEPSLYLLFNPDILIFLLNTNVGRHKRSKFIIFVVWSA